MTAAGTSGHGAELSAFFDLGEIGAVTVKSLSARPHAGNPAPRVHELRGAMINAIGLQNPGVERWLENDLPALRAAGARVVASIWGFTVEDFAAAAKALVGQLGSETVAVELNISCPNTESGGKMFSHDPDMSAAVMRATEFLTKPRWAKLSPNTADIVDIAGAVQAAGADAVTLTNTLVGLALDESGNPMVSNVTGGVSGPALHNIALRCVYQVRAKYRDLPIVGVGGINSAKEVVEFIRAGANAVQVGTATFENPRATQRIAREFARWCEKNATSVDQLQDSAHP